MKVLIAIQNYNGEKWLAECLASLIGVIRCSYEDEVKACVLDAGSTDRSLEIIQQFPEIELIQHPKLWQAIALNIAIRKYMDWFDWFSCFNNDDHLLPNFVQAHKKTIITNPDADLLHGYCIFWLEGQKALHLPDPFVWEDRMRIGHNFISHPTILISNNCMQKYGILAEDIQYPYDWEYTTRVWKNGGKIVVTPEPLAFYRSRMDNMRHTVTREIFPEWKAIGLKNCGVDVV